MIDVPTVMSFQAFPFLEGPYIKIILYCNHSGKQRQLVSRFGLVDNLAVLMEL